MGMAGRMAGTDRTPGAAAVAAGPSGRDAASAAGWAAAVMVQALSAAYYGFRERQGAGE